MQDYHTWNKNAGLPYMEGKETGRSRDLKPMIGKTHDKTDANGTRS